MKKMIAIVLAGYLVIGLLACGAKEVSDDGAGAATEAVQSTSLTEGRGEETQNNNVPESNTQAADSSTPNANTQALSEEQLETYVGTYINTSTNNTCSFIGYDGNNGRVYKVEEIAVNNATRTSPDGICSPFSASELEQNADGNFSIRRPTYLDFCTVTFLPDNQIVLKLEYDDGTYEETFSKQ